MPQPRPEVRSQPDIDALIAGNPNNLFRAHKRRQLAKGRRTRAPRRAKKGRTIQPGYGRRPQAGTGRPYAALRGASAQFDGARNQST